MKLLEEVEKILEHYYLGVNVPDEYPNVYRYRDEHPEKVDEDFNHPTINDRYLCEKFEDNIPEGWYGFSIGIPTPINWYIVIERVTDLLVKNDPDFEIHQVKMKFGGIRYYVESEKIEDIFEICRKVENSLHDMKMMY